MRVKLIDLPPTRKGVKEAWTSPPVLALPDFSKQFKVRADASLLGTGGVLMQDGRFISYISKKFSSAVTRYHTGEQVLLALIHALKEWRCYLEGVRVRLITDHHPLVYLQTQPSLSAGRHVGLSTCNALTLSWCMLQVAAMLQIPYPDGVQRSRLLCWL
jgi:hypothetical protein